MPTGKPSDTAPKFVTASDILTRMARTYQGLPGYHATATVTARVVYQGQTRNTATLQTETQYRRPLLLQLTLTTPQGSRRIYSSGVQFVRWDTKANTYATRPGPTNWDDLIADLGREGVFAQFDPLFFLSRQTLPSNMGNFRLKAPVTLDGQAHWVVGATRRVVNPAAAAPRPGQPPPRPLVETWTWTINQATGLLRRVEMRSSTQSVPVRRVPNGQPGRLTQKTGKPEQTGASVTKPKTVQLPAVIDVVQDLRVLSTTGDTALTEFRFVPPPGTKKQETP